MHYLHMEVIISPSPSLFTLHNHHKQQFSPISSCFSFYYSCNNYLHSKRAQ
ncbi:hypothetical protein KSS87_010882, partial [Heliosperma pusillum]